MGKISRHQQLASNLPQLQNFAKKDPESYKDECEQQYRHFLSVLEVFKLKPSQHNKEFNSLVAFMCQISHCYPTLFKDLSSQLMDLLKKHYTLMDADTRMVLCNSLILLRRKNLMTPISLLEFFFHLLSCQDKALRQMLFTYIVTDVKRINSKHKDVRLNTTLQNFMYSMLAHHNATAAKLSLDTMISLYRKNVWNDVKTVNVITTACFSKVTKIMVAALTFFLGNNEDDKDGKDGGDSGSDSEPEQKTAREIQLAHRVGKKSKKRKKQLQRAMSVLKRTKKKHKAPAVNFSALYLIHDPQGFAEKLFKQLESSTERFEVKLMTMNLVSRLIGVHQLLLINFYPLLQRFLQPHQREVAQILLCAAQACHELVPPDVARPVLRAIANNFITERNTTECMACGINTIREMCSRCVPSVIGDELLQDLTQYKSYRDKNVAVAARSLISLFRVTNPDLLQRKDKGKPTEATRELVVNEFGESKALQYVPGAEVLPEKNTDEDWCSTSEEEDEEGDGSDWVDVVHSDDGGEDTANGQPPQQEALSKEEKVAKCSDISSGRFITQDEFRQIRVTQMRKQLEARKPRSNKRKAADGQAADTLHIDDSGDDNDELNPELVKMSTITHLAKKRKMSREEKIERAREGKMEKPKFGHKDNKHQVKKGNTNKEKRKNKAFMMVRPKLRMRNSKRSFRDKQIALRNSLLKQQRNFK